MRQFPGNNAKNLMCKILPRKFYYLQAHESFYKECLVHPQGRSLKELDQYLNFSQEQAWEIRKF